MTAHQQSSANVIHFLEKVSLFSEIAKDESALNAISKAMTHRKFKNGEMIIEQGKPGAELYVLTEGHVGVYKKNPEGDAYKVVVLHAKNHASFGEGGLMDGEVRSATIVCESDVECLVLNQKDFAAFCAERPHQALPIVKKIAQSLMVRLNQTSHDLMLLHKALMTEIRSS